jgi:hypothetical protein
MQLQGATTARPDQTDLESPPVLEVGKNNQGHDDASMEGDITSWRPRHKQMNGFLPGLTINPMTKLNRVYGIHRWPNHRRESGRNMLPK